MKPNRQPKENLGCDSANSPPTNRAQGIINCLTLIRLLCLATANSDTAAPRLPNEYCEVCGNHECVEVGGPQTKSDVDRDLQNAWGASSWSSEAGVAGLRLRLACRGEGLMSEKLEFAERYRALPDHEVVALATEIDALVPAARLALADELAARNIDIDAAITAFRARESDKLVRWKLVRGRSTRFVMGFLAAAFLIGGFDLHLGGLGTVFAYLLSGLLVDLIFRPRNRQSRVD